MLLNRLPTGLPKMVAPTGREENILQFLLHLKSGVSYCKKLDLCKETSLAFFQHFKTMIYFTFFGSPWWESVILLLSFVVTVEVNKCNLLLQNCGAPSHTGIAWWGYIHFFVGNYSKLKKSCFVGFDWKDLSRWNILVASRTFWVRSGGNVS